MVVGLLVMLAMIGTTFVITSFLDRRESFGIAAAAPMKQVARGILQQILTERLGDLYIDDKGTQDPSDDVIYGSADDYKKQVDYPHEDFDKVLACFAPVDAGDGNLVWKHISNLFDEDSDKVTDVPVDSATLVDTDGYYFEFPAGTKHYGDAILHDTNVNSPTGQRYYVAVRIIDASALINVDTAYSTATAAANTVMPVTNISLDVMTDAATRDRIHAGDADTGLTGRDGGTGDDITTYNANYVQRPLNPANGDYRPYDAGDMLALAWGAAEPSTATGRIYQALGTWFAQAKPYLTTFSASRDYVRWIPLSNENLRLTHEVNINTASFLDLFKAFYNAIPADVPGFPAGDQGRRLVAAQLAVNVIDFCDNDDIPYRPTAADMATINLAGQKVFGIERQPFITEAWLRLYYNGSAVEQLSAIELYNPYKTAISLNGYKLQVGANTYDATLPASIPAGGRIVLVSNSTKIRAVNAYTNTSLDLRQTCTLLRPTTGADYAPVGQVGFDDFGLTVPDAGDPGPVFRAIRRDDAPARAKYSVAIYKDYNVTYCTDDPGYPSPDTTNLGRSNVSVDDAGLAALNVAPTPVFVRNLAMITLGDLSRIFYVGPKSDGTPLDKALESMAPSNSMNGRLNLLGGIKSGGWGDNRIPDIPAACMMSDYLATLVPDANNDGRTDTLYGRININTAPWQVIRYLPGISALGQRDSIARDVVAYRDLLNNSADTGGHDYSTDRSAVGITDLRADPGFASAGEIAIPLAKVLESLGLYPNNNYGTNAPNCYTISDGETSDDGLDQITGQPTNSMYDITKYDIYYAWLINQITVRSDVYIAFIRVDMRPVGEDLSTANTRQPLATRRYIAVVDRTDCTSSEDLPRVLLFTEMTR